MKELSLHFLGKDSVLYDKRIELPDEVYDTIASIIGGKKQDEEVFDKISSGDVSNLLKSIYGDAISPKVLRTAKCNMTLIDALKRENVSKKDSEADKIRALYRANLEIAKTLNHQKNVAKNQKEQESKLKEKALLQRDKLEALRENQKAQLEKIRADKKKAKIALKSKPDLLKARLEALKEREAKMKLQLEKAEERIDKAKFNLEKKRETADINLGTSLASYADFRVVYSWCKDVGLDPKKVYNKSLFERSQWAADTPASFWKEI